MSLVNQVLKDLEKRRNVSGDASGLRATLDERRRRLPTWLPWVTLAVVLGVALFTVDRMYLRTPPTPVVAVPTVETVPEPSATEAVPEPVAIRLPALTRVNLNQRADGSLVVALQADEPMGFRHDRSGDGRRLTLELPGIDADTRPGFSVPSGQSLLTDLGYETTADGSLALVFVLHEDAVVEVDTLAPGLITVDIGIPAPEPVQIVAAPVQEPTPEPEARRPQPEPQLERTLVARSPRQRAEDAYDEGVRALTEGNRSRAESGFRDALGHDATLHAARLALANLLYQQGRLREAEIQLQEGLRISPGEPAMADRYARQLLERGDLAGAIGVLADNPPAIETHPEHHALLAALLQRAGNHAAAADSYAALVAIRPDQGLWWMGLGISLEAANRGTAALDAYRRATRDPRLAGEVVRFLDERINALSLSSGERR